MNVHAIYNRISPWFRRRRLARFQAVFKPTAQTTLLDVGGYPWCWPEEVCPAQITMVNLEYPHVLPSAPGRRMVRGDGCALAFPDASFDIGFSNSVIEHVGTWENQQKFAAGIRRVGRRIWVQTPAHSFPIEPHLLAPFIHWLPKSAQRPLLRWFTGWGWITKPTPAQVDAFLAEVRLLTFREMQVLFPDCRIERERFLWLFTKSYIAVRDSDSR